VLDALRRKGSFSSAAEEIFTACDECVLPVDIAAIYCTQEATLATRTVKDFQATGIEITDPWQPS
jgi:hypothetical protein